MGRDIFLTDYSNQSLSEIKKDLQNWLISIQDAIDSSKNLITTLGDDWKALGYDNFRVTALGCYNLLETAKEDIAYVLKEIDQEIKEHHVKMLRRLGDKGSELNREIGLAKHQGGRYLQDGAEYQLYCDLRDSMVNLIDLQELSERLKDFVGMKKKEVNWSAISSNFIAFFALIVSILAYLKGQ